jgi:hypothetical protein
MCTLVLFAFMEYEQIKVKGFTEYI